MGSARNFIKMMCRLTVTTPEKVFGKRHWIFLENEFDVLLNYFDIY